MSFEPLLGSGPVGSRTSLDTAAPWPGNETEAGWNIPGLFENIGKPWENRRKNPPFTSYSSGYFCIYIYIFFNGIIMNHFHGVTYWLTTCIYGHNQLGSLSKTM